MIASTMISLLRRRLKDPDPDGGGGGTNWSNAELLEILNVAGLKVQALVLSVDPEAYLQRTRQNIETGLDRYPKPDGSRGLRQLRYLDSGGVYRDLGDPITPEQAALAFREPTSTAVALPRWSWFGRFITLHPTPTANKTDGLEWWTVPADTVAVLTDQFRTDIGLHNMIVNEATLILSPESSADVNVEEVRKQIAEDIQRIPLYYRRTLKHDIPFSVGVEK